MTILEMIFWLVVITFGIVGAVIVITIVTGLYLGWKVVKESLKDG